uniref:Uncharacterized protein n=1 Tax=Anguilla anguilla TaxID=7936 RepID=A0A0E9WFL8_ANGAN
MGKLIFFHFKHLTFTSNHLEPELLASLRTDIEKYVQTISVNLRSEQGHASMPFWAQEVLPASTRLGR